MNIASVFLSGRAVCRAAANVSLTTQDPVVGRFLPTAELSAQVSSPPKQTLGFKTILLPQNTMENVIILMEQSSELACCVGSK